MKFEKIFLKHLFQFSHQPDRANRVECQGMHQTGSCNISATIQSILARTQAIFGKAAIQGLFP